MDAGWRSAWSGWRGWSETSCPRLTACWSSSRPWRSPRARRSRTWASCLTASPTTREVRGHSIELQRLITALTKLIIWGSFTSRLHRQNFVTLSHDFQTWFMKMLYGFGVVSHSYNICPDAERRKEMEEMILNWEADSRPATAEWAGTMFLLWQYNYWQ